ncbi:fasciclin domain-containing protein [Salinimicrobium sp. CDJ15-81-2]|nr:fasciclin domain-containing protein [Salinimicrobium nanhaiense]
MYHTFIKIFPFLISLFLISCQDKKEDQDPEIDIIPQEENTAEVNEQNRPMPRSFMLAKMREEGDLTSFTEQLERSGIEDKFKGDEGIYTFFAPSNAAYDKIPAKEVNPDGSTKTGESQADLMRYYMVEGEMTVDYLIEQIKAAEDGSFEFRTAMGEKIWATEEGGKIILTDVLGNKAAIVTSNMEENYGVYHIIDNVLQPGTSEKK